MCLSRSLYRFFSTKASNISEQITLAGCAASDLTSLALTIVRQRSDLSDLICGALPTVVMILALCGTPRIGRGETEVGETALSFIVTASYSTLRTALDILFSHYRNHNEMNEGVFNGEALLGVLEDSLESLYDISALIMISCLRPKITACLASCCPGNGDGYHNLNDGPRSVQG